MILETFYCQTMSWILSTNVANPIFQILRLNKILENLIICYFGALDFIQVKKITPLFIPDFPRYSITHLLPLLSNRVDFLQRDVNRKLFCTSLLKIISSSFATWLPKLINGKCQKLLSTDFY